MDLTALRAANPDHWAKASAIRALTLDAVAAANSGHSGMPMGMADVATVLFEKHMKFDATAPDWADRDRFVLSAGHGSMLLYSLLHLTGYADMTLEQVKNFRQLGAITAGHPEYGHAKGIETTTGPLGQGLATAVGMAIAETHLRASWGRKIVDYHTYVIAGDGCLMEGVSQEAITLAGRLRLGKLIVFWDDNGITIDGKVEITDATDQVRRFRSAQWEVLEINGHNLAEIDESEAELSPDDDPLQDTYRAWLLRTGYIQGAWRADRSTVDRRHKGSLRLGVWRIRNSCGCESRMGSYRHTRHRSSPRMGNEFHRPERTPPTLAPRAGRQIAQEGERDAHQLPG